MLEELIANIVIGKITPEELYALLSKSGSEGGLGRLFFDKHPLIGDAFDINDKQKKVTIKNVQALQKLAEAYEQGRMSSHQDPAAAAFFLALIIYYYQLHPKDLNNALLINAYNGLLAYYGENNTKVLDGRISLREMLRLRYEAYLLSANLIPAKDVVLSQKLPQNSAHKREVVQHGGKEYLVKKDIPDAVAQLEAFSAETFRFLQGKYQPQTRIIKAFGDQHGRGFSDVASEKIDYIPFSESSTQRFYRYHHFEPFAALSVYAYALAEDDLHDGNFGLRYFANGSSVAVRIDFDRCLFPLAAKYAGFADKIKSVIVSGRSTLVTGAHTVDGFGIHAADLEALPELPELDDDLQTKEELSQHFVPSNWPHNAFINNTNNVGDYEAFKRSKHKAFLNFMLMPEAIVRRIAMENIYDASVREEAVTFVLARKALFREAALKIPEFLSFLEQHGEEVKRACLEASKAFIKDNLQYRWLRSEQQCYDELDAYYEAEYRALPVRAASITPVTQPASPTQFVPSAGRHSQDVSPASFSLSSSSSSSFFSSNESSSRLGDRCKMLIVTEVDNTTKVKKPDIMNEKVYGLNQQLTVYVQPGDLIATQASQIAVLAKEVKKFTPEDLLCLLRTMWYVQCQPDVAILHPFLYIRQERSDSHGRGLFAFQYGDQSNTKPWLKSVFLVQQELRGHMDRYKGDPDQMPEVLKKAMDVDALLSFNTGCEETACQHHAAKVPLLQGARP